MNNIVVAKPVTFVMVVKSFQFALTRIGPLFTCNSVQAGVSASYCPFATHCIFVSPCMACKVEKKKYIVAKADIFSNFIWHFYICSHLAGHMMFTCWLIKE